MFKTSVEKANNNNKNNFNSTRRDAFVFWFKNLGFIKHILVAYLLITLIGSGFLMMPISINSGIKVKYLDALFISASSFSDTGLTTINTTETWTIFGQFIISILILIGGIGWFALKIFIVNILFKKRISFATSKTLSAERGSVKVGETSELIKTSIISILSVMTFFGFILSIYFYFSPIGFNEEFAGVGNKISGSSINPTGDWGLSIRYGLFHAISAVNNAGFDIMGGHSISPYYNDYFVQFIFMFLFIFGGIGYPVIYDIKRFINAKRTNIPFKFSLFTKVSCITYILISLFGISFVFISEITAKGTSQNPTFWDSNYIFFDSATPHTPPLKASITKGEKVMALIFNTMSTRNAGFATINFHSLSKVTLMIQSLMMFIGSAPSSTAGGIRTTTFAIVCLSFWRHIRGKSSTRVFKRKINEGTVTESYLVTTTSIFLVIIVSLIAMTSLNSNGGQLPTGMEYNPLTGNPPTYSFAEILFETSSAFGTTGLSTGLTSGLSSVSKIFFIILMFIGQLGVSSTILSLGNKKQASRHYKYIEEKITIG